MLQSKIYHGNTMEIILHGDTGACVYIYMHMYTSIHVNINYWICFQWIISYELTVEIPLGKNHWIQMLMCLLETPQYILNVYESNRILWVKYHYNQKKKQLNIVRIKNKSYLYPIGSMYGTYGNIYHQCTPNDSIYTIHGSYGYGVWSKNPPTVHSTVAAHHHHPPCHDHGSGERWGNRIVENMWQIPKEVLRTTSWEKKTTTMGTYLA